MPCPYTHTDKQDEYGKQAPDGWHFVGIVCQCKGQDRPRQDVEDDEPPCAIGQGQHKGHNHIGRKPRCDPGRGLKRDEKAVVGNVPSDVPFARNGTEFWTTKRRTRSATPKCTQWNKLDQQDRGSSSTQRQSWFQSLQIGEHSSNYRARL